MNCLERENIRSGFKDNLMFPDIVDVDRGGKATFHDQGQLMIYPVCYLPDLAKGVKNFVINSLIAVVNALKSIGINCEIDSELLGLWSGNKKIASAGFRIINRLSDHGIALYFESVPKEFDCFSPCGISGLEYTSVFEILKTPVEKAKLIDLINLNYNKVFGQ